MQFTMDRTTEKKDTPFNILKIELILISWLEKRNLLLWSDYLLFQEYIQSTINNC